MPPFTSEILAALGRLAGRLLFLAPAQVNSRPTRRY